MTLLEMIKEWRNGCSCAPNNPIDCHECTDSLIDAMENKLNKQAAIEKLKSEFETELLKIKQGGFGFAAFALSVACLHGYAAQAKSICSSPISHKDKYPHKIDFNYPECLNRIVDVAMEGVEAKILEFKKMDEHEEMMSRMSKPVTYHALPYSEVGGQGGEGIPFPKFGGMAGWSQAYNHAKRL